MAVLPVERFGEGNQLDILGDGIPHHCLTDVDILLIIVGQSGQGIADEKDVIIVDDAGIECVL